MIKRLNIRNIVIVLATLALTHFSVGLLISPKLGGLLVEKINKYSQAKIYIERVNIWPLTLSISLKNLKISDPQNINNKIIEIKQASVYASPLGLLSKRLVLSGIRIDSANINLEGEPDGTFNIQKITRPKASAKPITPQDVLESVMQKKDWFTRAYGLLKKKFSSHPAPGKEKNITKTIISLPKGRRVHFKLKDSYLLEINSLTATGSYLDLKNQDGRSVQVENVRIELGSIGFDPELGLRLGKVEVKGQIKNSGLAAGSLKFFYQSSFNKDGRKAQFNFILKDVDLDALRFIYEDSLPIEIAKGTLDLTSDTVLNNDAIDSTNQLTLSNHELKPKGLIENPDLFMPLPLLCEALNNINPLSLNFTISGTVDNPQFGGLMRSLADLVKPNLKNIGQMLKSEAVKKGIAGVIEAVSEKKQDNEQPASDNASEGKSDTQRIVDSLQSIFGKNK
ncbi:MAG: AsmA family protein [Candidatus Omnitrophota bacterium]